MSKQKIIFRFHLLLPETLFSLSCATCPGKGSAIFLASHFIGENRSVIPTPSPPTQSSKHFHDRHITHCWERNWCMCARDCLLFCITKCIPPNRVPALIRKIRYGMLCRILLTNTNTGCEGKIKDKTLDWYLSLKTQRSSSQHETICHRQ